MKDMDRIEKELIISALKFYKKHTLKQIKELLKKFGKFAFIDDKVSRITLIDDLIDKLSKNG